VAERAREEQGPTRPPRKVFGRNRGKHLKPSLARRLQDDLPRWRLPGVEWDENTARAPLDLGAILGERPVWLEIGFGGGEHLAHQAETHPHVAIVGAEPFADGVAKLLRAIDDRAITNVRVHPGDARDLLDVLPEGGIARAFLLYPDPWPKARHHGRRFVTPEHLRPLARAMAPGAELRVATDIEDYVRQTLEEVPAAGFALEARGPEPWADWTRTRYEAKALREGRVPEYLTFRRT
jgi:tRNA (guanine-N7-)-methyltransferase